MSAAVGASAAARSRNVSLHGRVTWEGLPEPGGLLTEVYARLRKARLVTEFGGLGEFEMGADGDLVWEKKAFGAEIHAGWVGSQQLREFGTARHVDWRQMYAKACCSGEREIDGRRRWEPPRAPRALLAVPEGSKHVPPPDLWSVDVWSGPPRRYVAKAVDPFGEPLLESIDVDDWRAVDGVRCPHRVRLEIGGLELVVAYDSIQHDVELALDFFAPDEVVRAALESRRSGDALPPVRFETLSERHVVAIIVTVPRSDLRRTLAVLPQAAMQHVLAAGVAMDGPPLLRFRG